MFCSRNTGKKFKKIKKYSALLSEGLDFYFLLRVYSVCFVLSDIIEVFGVETILIYTALMLKKRIAVYYPPHSIEDLLQFTR